LATISGGAMIARLPRNTVLKVVGTLSSSTQTNSGSLGTSPKRGFLMSSQRVSADLRMTEGSPGPGMPANSRIVAHPVAARASTTSRMSRPVTMGALP